MEKRPLIIDADPGCDDAQALMIAAGSGMFDIKGICAVHGNVELADTSRNALYLASVCGLECPVCVGAKEALLVRKPRAAYAHGGNGLAGFDYDLEGREFSSEKPWDLMYRQALACGGELEILMLGPVTDLAIAVLKYPDFASRVRQVTIMGGGATRGNTTPYAEFNIAQDPHALQIVLDAGFPRFVMVDLDCCDTAWIEEEELDFSALPASNPWAPLYAAMDDFHKSRKLEKAARRLRLVRGHHACDAVAAFVLCHPEDAVLEDYYVACETRSTISAGQTVVDWSGRMGRKPNVTLARKVDRDRYAAFYLECLKKYEGGRNDE